MRQKGDVLHLDLNSYTVVFTKILSNRVHFCALSKCMFYFSKNLLKVEIKKDFAIKPWQVLCQIFSFTYHLLLLVIVMIFRWTLCHLEYHLALACAASAASSRHFVFFARFQLVKDSCRSAACRSKRQSILTLWKNLCFRDTQQTPWKKKNNKASITCSI